ncbi:MAG TPA: DUF4388 domain-containing protein [Acidimicrobiales bacterium]|nr:DUF4388 domain-containing protein [Acidimicrobiales bacterium]
MALQGTLDTFALADLVRLLATTTKTGELSIDGDRGSGRLWFVDGDLVGGDPGGAESALFALLRLTDGTFRFEPDGGPDEPVEALDALDVLAGAEARLEAWRPVEALVPTPDVTLQLRAELDTDEVAIGRATWRQLMAIVPRTTARDFAAALGFDEVGAALALKDLVDLGLVEVGPAERDEPDDAPAAEVEPVAAEAPIAPVEAVDVLPAGDPFARDPFAPGPVPDEVPVDDEVAAPGDAPSPVGALADLLAPYDAEPLAHDPFALDPPVAVDASLAVDLDTPPGGPVGDHRYLGGEASTLPEALPEAQPEPQPEPAPELVAGPEGAAPDGGAEGTPDWPTPSMDEDDLALQLEALSPAAARAVAAAASAEGREAEEGDAGRRVLRRIISSGRG